MAPPPRLEDQDPLPENLVRFLLEQGDPRSALEVCRGWRRREPSNRKIDELEAAAAEIVQIDDPAVVFDVTTAEKYLQKGYLQEAAFIYGKVLSNSSSYVDEEVSERYEKLSEFIYDELPDDAPPQAREAEEQVRRRQLPMALLVYHELAQSQPDNQLVRNRRDLLRSLLVDMPSTVRAEEIASLSDTITDSVEVESNLEPKKKRRRLPARTWKTSPPDECVTSDDPEPEEPDRRRRIKTQVDLPLQACFEAIEAAKASEALSAEKEKRQNKDSTLPSPTAPSERQIPVLEPLMSPSEGAVEPPVIDVPPPVTDEPPCAEEPQREDEPSLIIDDGPPEPDKTPIVPSFPEEPIPMVFEDPPPYSPTDPLPTVHDSARTANPDESAHDSWLEPAVIDDGPPPRLDQAPPEPVAPIASEQEQLGPERDSWQEPAPVEPSHTSWLEPLIDDPPGRTRDPEEAARDSWRSSSDEVDIDAEIYTYEQDWTDDGGRQKKRKRRGPRTQPSVSPMVVPRDESGRSVVEVPQDVPSVMERVSSRMSAREAAALAEPLGVLVRAIYIIE